MGGGGEASGPEHQPEVVHSGKSFRLGYAEAARRYARASAAAAATRPTRCSASPTSATRCRWAAITSSPTASAFPEGTLLIRCRADHVEVTRTLK